MAVKKYDVVVKVGTYEKNGETKNRYKNVGSIMESEPGKMFLLLERSFNPAGIINPDNRESVLLSLFEPKAPSEGNSEQTDINWKN